MHFIENYRERCSQVYCWSKTFSLLSFFMFFSLRSHFFAFHCLQTITHEHKSAIFFRSFVQVESEVQTRLPLDSFSRSLCFCGSFVSVFFVSLAQRHILTSRVGMQHEGESGCEVGVQRAYTKSISTDPLELMEDTGSGSNFKKNHTEPGTR